MPFLDRIVNKVDELIVASSLTDQRFQNRFFAGLVQQQPISNIDGTKVIFAPIKMNGFEEGVQIVPDDNFNIITYHRIISNTYSRGRVEQSFGDGFEAQQSVSDVIMVVIGFNNKLLITSEQVEALFVAGFPDAFTKKNTGTFVADLQMSSISVQIASSSFDSVAIFRQEYSGEKNYIRPNMSLFQIRYKIEATYKKGCFTICEDC